MDDLATRLCRARLRGGELEFSAGGSLATALAHGCFFLEIPAGLELEPGVRLCREFYRDGSGYRGHRTNGRIYFDREHFQTEHLLADGPCIREFLPPPVVVMTSAMFSLARQLLCSALAELAIPRSEWSKVTGGSVDGGGTTWFAASHYRSERRQLGCPAHKDTGFVTVLYIEQDGLEVRSGDGAWVPLAAVPGYFVINFGGAFEYLTQHLERPVSAILHRVRECPPSAAEHERFSFAAFLNPPASGQLYQVTPDGVAHARQSVEEFLREFNRKTWDDKHDDFGIAS